MAKSAGRILVVLMIIATTLLSSCASMTRLGGPEHSCSPGFFPENELGSLSAQQRGPGHGIQWGVYPRVAGTRFVVDVFVNNRRVDHKDQVYPPHGSVNRRAIRSGDIFRLEGQATNARGDVAIFYLVCRAA